MHPPANCVAACANAAIKARIALWLAKMSCRKLLRLITWYRTPEYWIRKRRGRYPIRIIHA
jgi:hypothetical protein